MRCPLTTFDCITCEEKCRLIDRPGAEATAKAARAISCNGHERIYEDGAGYICRHCGEDLSDDEEE